MIRLCDCSKSNVVSWEASITHHMALSQHVKIAFAYAAAGQTLLVTATSKQLVVIYWLGMFDCHTLMFFFILTKKSILTE